MRMMLIDVAIDLDGERGFPERKGSAGGATRLRRRAYAHALMPVPMLTRTLVLVLWPDAANGILSVSAVEATSGSAAKITIENTDRLSAEEVERMVADAERFKAADELSMARVAARTKLEQYRPEPRTRCPQTPVHSVHGAPLRSLHRACRCRYLYACRKLLRDKDLRGRMEEEDYEALATALDTADGWIDAAADNEPAEAFEQRLLDLREVSAGPVLARYGARPEGDDAAGFGGGFGDDDDDFGNLGDHDEL